MCCTQCGTESKAVESALELKTKSRQQERKEIKTLNLISTSLDLCRKTQLLRSRVSEDIDRKMDQEHKIIGEQGSKYGC